MSIGGHIDELARDLGRLRRHVDPDGYAGLLVDRIADRLQSLDAATYPTAAERCRVNRGFGVSEDAAAAEALAAADARTIELQSLLGVGRKPQKVTLRAA